MAPRATLKGGPELKARLDALLGTPVEVGGAWQAATASRARASAPRATGRGAGSIRAGSLSPRGAYVIGAYWLIFIDRGTKAHDIRPKLYSGSGRGGAGTAHALRFNVGGETVFARKVHKRRQARRPFLTKAARDSITGAVLADAAVGLWNRKSRKGRWSRVKP